MKLQYWHHVYFWTVSTWSCLLLTLWPELWVWKRFVLVIGWLVPYPALIWPFCCWPGSKIFINNQSPGCLAVAEDYLSVCYRFAYVCWRNVLFFILLFLQAGRGDSLSRLFVFSLKTLYHTACVRWILLLLWSSCVSCRWLLVCSLKHYYACVVENCAYCVRRVFSVDGCLWLLKVSCAFLSYLKSCLISCPSCLI